MKKLVSDAVAQHDSSFIRQIITINTQGYVDLVQAFCIKPGYFAVIAFADTSGFVGAITHT